MSEKIRKHIIFYGRVQGVGFRYYSVYKSRQLGLTGWVRNLYDGTVEMEVQGEQQVHKTKQISGNGRYTRIGRRHFLSERQSGSFGEFLEMGI